MTSIVQQGTSRDSCLTFPSLKTPTLKNPVSNPVWCEASIDIFTPLFLSPLFFLFFFLFLSRSVFFFFPILPLFLLQSWSNGYRSRKWIRRPEFKIRTSLFVFYLTLISFRKVCIRLFSFQLWVVIRTYWALLSSYVNRFLRTKTLNFYVLRITLRLKVDVVSHCARAEVLVNAYNSSESLNTCCHCLDLFYVVTKF